MIDSDILPILNKHFKAVAVEKYPDAMLSTLCNNAMTEVLGKNFHKERVSENLRKKIRARLSQKLRAHYGKYVTIYEFDKRMQFRTNFEYVYKTEHGKLYGCGPQTSLNFLYFTSHSLEQFDERVPQSMYADLSQVFRKGYETYPTAMDIMKFFLISATQFGFHKQFVHANINYGTLVLEPLTPEIFIVKTFLSPEMTDKNAVWYNLALAEDLCLVQIKDNECRALADSSPIAQPKFYSDEYTYDFFVKSLLRPRGIL